MLLRIAGPLGATAVAGLLACSSESTPGVATLPPSDASDDAVQVGVGSVAEPPGDAGDAGDAEVLLGSVHGVVPYQPDAGDAATTVTTGISTLMDSGVNGLVVHPDGSTLLGVVANPGDGG
jgi:hypothetical protein